MTNGIIGELIPEIRSLIDEVVKRNMADGIHTGLSHDRRLAPPLKPLLQKCGLSGRQSRSLLSGKQISLLTVKESLILAILAGCLPLAANLFRLSTSSTTLMSHSEKPHSQLLGEGGEYLEEWNKGKDAALRAHEYIPDKKPK
jgi:hypothetical protein